jgi:hypothetical protein
MIIGPAQVLDFTIEDGVKGIVRKTASKEQRCRAPTATFCPDTSGTSRTAAIKENSY